VPSFRRRASVLDADRVEKAQEEPDRAVGVAKAKALAEAAEAEAAEAKAIAAAARARAKAIRLRKQAEAVEAVEAETSDDVEASDDAATDTEDAAQTATALDEVDTVDEVTAEEADDSDDYADSEDGGDVAVEAPEETPARKRRFRLPRPSWKRVAAAVAILCTCALLAASGYMIWHHRQAVQEQQMSAEYAAAGRQSVVTLMSLDHNRAQEDVQRIIDNSIGQFKDDFQNQAEDFVRVAQESKVVTEVTVNAIAVESMNPDSAVVLVAASSRVTNSAGAKQEPRTWRLSVSLQRDGGQIKMSKVEFVP
jgi:Mce-associated membrane protein